MVEEDVCGSGAVELYASLKGHRAGTMNKSVSQGSRSGRATDLPVRGSRWGHPDRPKKHLRSGLSRPGWRVRLAGLRGGRLDRSRPLALHDRPPAVLLTPTRVFSSIFLAAPFTGQSCIRASKNIIHNSIGSAEDEGEM